MLGCGLYVERPPSFDPLHDHTHTHAHTHTIRLFLVFISQPPPLLLTQPPLLLTRLSTPDPVFFMPAPHHLNDGLSPSSPSSIINSLPPAPIK